MSRWKVEYLPFFFIFRQISGAFGSGNVVYWKQIGIVKMLNSADGFGGKYGQR